MIEWSTLSDFIASFAGFLSSLTVIVTAVYQWIWKPYTKNKEKREKEWQDEMLKISKQQVNPVSEELKLLAEQSQRHDEMDRKLEEIAQQNISIIKEMREEFKEHNHYADDRDRLIAQNAEILQNHEERFKGHDKRLDDHNERLVVLETKNGIRRITYREEGD